MNTIDRTDFEEVELRAGTMAKEEEFAEAREPAFNILIDFREENGYESS